MKTFNYFKYLLFSFFLLCLGQGDLSAQVTFIDSPVTTGGVLPNYTAPAGNDRLLVIVFSDAYTSTDPSVAEDYFYDTPDLVPPLNEFQKGPVATGTSIPRTQTTIYYLPLGSGAAMNPGIIRNFFTSPRPDDRTATIFTLENVDQMNPISAMATRDEGDGSTLELANTSAGSLIIEVLRSTDLTLMPLNGQSIIDERTLSTPFFGTARRVASASMMSPGGDVSLGWSDNGLAHVAIAFAPAAPPIPTMGQWSLFILSLLLLSLGVISVQRRELA